jgi:NAD(P)-dependent dehydrogenase (short-subunit alcohol dehydrogenase family)
MVGVLEGKTAIVTGGGRGVGRGIALALAADGASVVVCGRTEEPLVETVGEIEARGGRAVWIVSNITVPVDVDACIALACEQFGGVDILVNNATLVPHGTLLDISEELVNEAWAAGPVAAWRFMVKVHPRLVERGGGAIVNVSSGAAIHPNVPARGTYAAIKAALGAYSRAAAMEWAGDGIRVNTIMPVALTDAFQSFMDNEPDGAAAVVAGIPLGRVGDPEMDIGRAVVFLCGPDATYLTGATLPLDGGLAYLR